MSRESINEKNRNKVVCLGLIISALRKARGWSQEELAELADISRSHLSAIETPGNPRNFSMDSMFKIADALEVDPVELLRTSLVPKKILNHEEIISRMEDESAQRKTMIQLLSEVLKELRLEEQIRENGS